MALRLLQGWAGLRLSAGWLEWLMHKKAVSCIYVLQPTTAGCLLQARSSIDPASPEVT